VIGVADPSSDEHPRVTPHEPPAPSLCTGIGGEDEPVLIGGDTARVARAYINTLSAGSVAILNPVRLAAHCPAERLVTKVHASRHGLNLAVGSDRGGPGSRGRCDRREGQRAEEQTHSPAPPSHGGTRDRPSSQ
jgi:hypothetical protein